MTPEHKKAPARGAFMRSRLRDYCSGPPMEFYSGVDSFTCPNNVSIVTGSPPAVHGISGNFYLDPATGKAVVMTGPELMRSSTVLAEFSRVGAKGDRAAAPRGWL